MKTDEMKNSSVFKVAGVMVLTGLFILAFILLINKHSLNLGDVVNNSFNYKTIEGKQLVIRDTKAIYPKFYVIFFNNTNDTYIIHNFNYYTTSSQYDLEYQRLFNNVIDYNVNENMLRINYGDGNSTYYIVKNNIQSFIDIDSFEIL